MSESADEEKPRIAGRFETQHQIGVGGLSNVYRAWDHHLDRPVAVKRMKRADEQDNRELVSSAWREAMTTASLQHPNVVTIFDFGVDDSGAYVVMELIEGESLEQCLERGPLHMNDFHRFATQSLEGLIAAHAVGLIHRDLKPGNFMLQQSGVVPFVVKILDFGLAKYINTPQPQSIDHYNSLMGSIHYMAPEQFQREPLDQRTDLYSLGCIFYEGLTGHTAFTGETISEMIDAHVKRWPHPVHALRPDMSARLEKWLMKFLQKKPDDRYKSAVEALRTLPSLADCVKGGQTTTRSVFPGSPE